MNQCVPNWDLDDPPPNQRQHLPLHHHPSAVPMSVQVSLSLSQLISCNENSRFDSELAELTWENGHLAMHGFRHPGIANPIPKPTSSAIPTIWEKPGPTGMLESIIDQATRFQLPEPISWLGLPLPHEPRNPATAADALVPCSDHDYQADWVPDPSSGPNCASQGSSAPTSGRNESNAVTLDTSGDDVGFTTTTTTTSASPDFGFTTTSASPSPGEGGGSPETEDTSFGGAHYRRSQREEDKVSKGAMRRSSISTKRSRASAVHNQYERKRRDRINQRMKTLQKLVPNSSKTDKASMLDEVIEYLKQLEAQVQMMNTMRNIPHMMMPMAMPQLQMSMLAQMTQMAQMGMVMGMMDTNTLGLHGHAGMPTVHHPSAFLSHLGRRSWNVPNDQMKQPCNGATLPNPFSSFFACPPQQHMGMDPFNRMAAFYRQFYQQAPPSNPKI